MKEKHDEVIQHVWRVSRPRAANNYRAEAEMLGVFIDDRSIDQHFKYTSKGVVRNARISSTNFTCVIADKGDERPVVEAIYAEYQKAIDEAESLVDLLKENKEAGARWL